MTKGRLEAFSDGVIAIIITITILEIGLPNGNDMRALLEIMPLVICYLISFIMVGTNWAYLFILSFQPVTTGWVGKSNFAMLPVRVYVLMNFLGTMSYILLQHFIITAHDCEILKITVSESRKENWTVFVELIALILSFIPRVHYLSCPLLVVAVAPWIIPDLRMKRFFEESQKPDSQC